MAKGKPFAPEFRQEAVRLYRVSGKPFLEVAPSSSQYVRNGTVAAQSSDDYVVNASYWSPDDLLAVMAERQAK